MNSITNHAAIQMLRHAGFQEVEIERLDRFRRSYRVSAQDQPPLDLRRLQFVRWLVTTGRLSDHFPSDGFARQLPSQEKWPRW